MFKETFFKMLLEEDILFFSRHSPQVVCLKGLHSLWRLSIFSGVR